MDALHSLTLAAALVANRMTVPQVEEYLAQLDPQDARRVRAALEAIGRAMADLMRGAPAPQAVPLAEPRQVLQQVLGDELGRLDDALRFARGKDPDTTMPLLEWRRILVTRLQALEAVLAKG